MTRVMRCPSCGDEYVVEMERTTSYMGLIIDDEGKILDTGNMEFNYDDSVPIGMWCRVCHHEEYYSEKATWAEIRQTRLRWSKTTTDSQ